MKRSRKQRALRDREQPRQRSLRTAQRDDLPDGVEPDDAEEADTLDLLVARSVLGYDA